MSDGLEVVSGPAGQVGALGEVLAQQAVGVLVARPLPWRVRPARSSGGRHRLRSSRNNYALFNNPLLHGPVELAIYTSLDFALAAGNADMHLSFGSTGDAFDNAAMETFWARLKVEINWIRGSIWFDTRAAAHAYLFEFIEVFYNRQRHQTGIGHLTPTEYADKWRRDHEGLDLT